jgi:hypothetical protein
MPPESIRTIRAALRAAFGPRQYRITADGHIHVRGVMPNTRQTGWYLFGDANSAETYIRIRAL